MEMLEISRFFFEYLNSRNIKYCHWKSNSRLKEALNGGTDLDILVHSADISRFQDALKKFGMKEILSPRGRQYPALEDYLGFDYNAGKLIHLHVHYKLILGQRYIKNHHLPIEDFIFENLIQKNGVYIPCPEIELILLIIRAHMKLTACSMIIHAVNNLMGRYSTPYTSDIEQEFMQLLSSSDVEKAKEFLRLSNLPLSEKLFAKFIAKLSEKKLNFYDVFTIRDHVFSALDVYCRDKSTGMVLKYYSILFQQWLPFKKLLKSEKKTIPFKGKVFSLVGADGSGKSTLVIDLCKWLSWRLAVNNYYYGIPKNSIVKGLSLGIRLFKKIHLSFIANLLISYLLIYIAKDKYSTYKKILAIIGKGEIAITDRFPLETFRNMKEPMDGPLLKSQGSRICKYFSSMEEKYYDMIPLPDLVIVLSVNINELRKRKVDLSLADHTMKADAVNRIKETPQICVLDANKPYSEVCLEIKRKIWEML